jgi:hypothetical protein
MFATKQRLSESPVAAATEKTSKAVSLKTLAKFSEAPGLLPTSGPSCER